MKPAPTRETPSPAPRQKPAVGARRKRSREKIREYNKKAWAKLAPRLRDNGRPAKSQTKCLWCGMVYDRLEARLRGFKIVHRFRNGTRCICDCLPTVPETRDEI